MTNNHIMTLHVRFETLEQRSHKRENYNDLNVVQLVDTDFDSLFEKNSIQYSSSTGVKWFESNEGK